MRILVTLALLAGSAHADPPDPDHLDARGWFAAHGVKLANDAFSNAEGCSELAVGKDKEPALRCSEVRNIGDEHAFAVIVHEIVRVVRDHKPVVVLDAEVVLDRLDSVRPGDPPILGLELGVAADGHSATIVERTPGSCTPSTLAAQSNASAAKSPWTALIVPNWGRLCSGVGVYRWRGGRFQRAK